MSWFRVSPRWFIALLALACDDGSSTAPVTTLPAESITFVDDGTTVKGSTVQAVLEDLDQGQAATVAHADATKSTIEAIVAQVDALQTRITALETERDALHAANATLAARVQALEDAPPPVVDVLASPVVSNVLPAASLLVTLEALHESLAPLSELQSDVASLEGTATTLASLSSALTECPSGTSPAGDFCMELTTRGETNWSDANSECAEDGGHLCSTGEFATACTSTGPLYPGIESQELTTNIVVDPVTGITGAVQLFDGASCSFTSDKYSALNFAPYRCCYDRLVLGAGPTPAEPALP